MGEAIWLFMYITVRKVTGVICRPFARAKGLHICILPSDYIVVNGKLLCLYMARGAIVSRA